MTLAGLSVADLLDAVAARTSAPGGGAVTGLAAALAASLAAMSARFAAGDLQDLAARAEELRSVAAELAQADVAAYAAYLQARRAGDGQESARLLDLATDVPLRLTEVGEEVARLGLRLATDGNPRLRGDAATAVLLAAATVRSAAVLVCENLASSPADPRLAAVGASVAAVRESEQALLARYPELGPTLSA